MKNALKKLSATLVLLAVSAQALPLSQIDIGDTCFINNIFSENDLVLVKRIDKSRSMVKVQYMTGGIDWVHSSKLLSTSEARKADIEETLTGAAIIGGAIWAICDPDGFERAMKSSPKKPANSNPHAYVKPAPVQSRPDTKTFQPKPAANLGPNPLGALPNEPTVDGYWSLQGDEWIDWAQRSLKSKTGRQVKIDSVRTKLLPFYSSSTRKVYLAEAKAKYFPGSYYLLTVPDENATELLGSRGGPILSLNSYLKLDLSSPDQVRSYLKFFTSSISGEGGVFQIVDPQSSFLTASQKISLNLKPVSVRKQADGSWIADAHIIYGKALFEAQLTISRSGDVDMLNDKPIQEVTPSYVSNYTNSRRVAQKVSLAR